MLCDKQNLSKCLIILKVIPVPKTENYFPEIFPKFTNEQFMQHFRVSNQVLLEFHSGV